MKKMLLTIPITFLALLLVVGMGSQTCLADTINPIVLIDSNDLGSTVDVDIDDYGGYGLYYSLNSGTSWQLIEFTGSYPGEATLEGLAGAGQLVFGLDLEGDGMSSGTNLLSTDSYDVNLSFSGLNEDIVIENPDGWSHPVYNSASIWWKVSNGNGFQIDLITPEGTDGLSQVPIPTSVLLLGAGLLGIIGIGFRRRKSSAE
jgi:hypothetical protein